MLREHHIIPHRNESEGTELLLLLYKQDRTDRLTTAKSGVRGSCIFPSSHLLLDHNCLPDQVRCSPTPLILSLLPSLPLLPYLFSMASFSYISHLFFLIFLLSVKTMADYKLFSPHNSGPFGTLEIILTSSILQTGTQGSKQDSSSFLEQSFLVSQQKSRTRSPNF